MATICSPRCWAEAHLGECCVRALQAIINQADYFGMLPLAQATTTVESVILDGGLDRATSDSRVSWIVNKILISFLVLHNFVR